MRFLSTVYYRAFGDRKRILADVVEADSPEAAADDLFRAFNNAIPGYTGELAEKHQVRSMSVGDYVNLVDLDSGRSVVLRCVRVGWRPVVGLPC